MAGLVGYTYTEIYHMQLLVEEEKYHLQNITKSMLSHLLQTHKGRFGIASHCFITLGCKPRNQNT